MQDEPNKPYTEEQLHTTTPVIEPGLTFASVTDKISSIVLKRKTSLGWFIGFAISFTLFQLLLLTITNLVFNGIGLWGINVPVAWGVDILNFVWWIGIGHAGTLISAILRSEEHTSELQSQSNLVCRLLLEKKKTKLEYYASIIFVYS